MIITKKSVHIIDYESNNVYFRSVPSNFDEYISELIDYIENNKNTRPYKSTSDTIQVIVEAKKICHISDEETNRISFENIAKRLLNAEIDAQSAIGHMNINVKKGSLIQALIYNPQEAKFSYLLAKVEHSDFVDDDDFSFKTGFSKDKKNIWKSCIIDLSNPIEDIYYSKIYSDTSAKYWSKSFLEFVELNSDEKNTGVSFKETESVLKRRLKHISLKDYDQLRNSLIGYYRTHEFITYSEMIESVISNYKPYNEQLFTPDVKKGILDTLEELPAKKGFDAQFNAVPKEIKARMKRKFNVCDGVEVNVLHDIDSDTIRSTESVSGERLILIKTNNSEMFNTYYDNRINVTIDGEQF